jgi:diadenosine tetraphosphate (Ap4A) HIT family hydrolase
MNATIERFGGKGSLVAEYDHWLVMIRPQAITLGSLVVAAKSDAIALGALPAAAFAEQAKVIGDIEGALAKAVAYAKINYLMLMMVDPHVHFHAIPRYDGARELDGQSFEDRNWPKPPDLSLGVALTPDQVSAHVDWLKGYWPA